MEATTTVCLSFVIQIKSCRDRATMKTPLKAPIRGTFVGEGGKRKYGRAVHSDSGSRFRLASPRLRSSSTPPTFVFLFRLLPSSFLPSLLLLFLLHRGAPIEQWSRGGVMHGRGWLIIPGARLEARNPKHFRRTRANGKRARGTTFRVVPCWMTQGWAVISLNARLENWKWA